MPYSKATKEEKRIGLEVFFTDTPGIKGRLKKQPEDFIVTERAIEIEPLTEEAKAKRDPSLPLYTYAWVKSRNWESNRLLINLARQLNISYDKIFFAGSKDKRAITKQLMAFQAPLEDVKAVNLENVELSDFQISPRIFKIGDLLGNDFEVQIRDFEITPQEVKEIITNTQQQLLDLNGFPNFFGVQRFGVIRPVTQDIGKLIIHKKFEEAVWHYLGNPIPGEPEGDYKVREEFERSWDFEWALKNYPKHLVFERTLIKYLNAHPEDYTGALEQFPKNLRTMFINAYQSFLFNKMLSKRIRQGLSLTEPLIGDIVLPIDANKLPIHKTWIKITEQNQDKLTRLCKNSKAFISGVLFGSNSEFAEAQPGEIERKIIEKEGLKQNDFIIPEYPLLSSKGTRRELVSPTFDFSVEITPEYIKVKFGLNKGAYATVFLREYMKSNIRSY